MDAQTGKTLAIMEGGWLTALRTGAASGFATSLLARKHAHVLALCRGALAGASLVACATASTTPLFSWHEIAPGTHINAIGAFTPEMCEVDAETLVHARIVVDQREAALIEAGDLLQALASGHITGPATWTEIGELAIGSILLANQSTRLPFSNR